MPPWSCVAVAALDAPPSTQHPRGAPGATLRLLSIARRRAPGPRRAMNAAGPDLSAGLTIMD